MAILQEMNSSYNSIKTSNNKITSNTQQIFDLLKQSIFNRLNNNIQNKQYFSIDNIISTISWFDKLLFKIGILKFNPDDIKNEKINEVLN